MLTTKKATSLTGDIKIDDILVVQVQANISNETAGNTYINQSIINQELYTNNRKQCRQEISEFQEKVYEIEDQFVEEKAAE